MRNRHVNNISKWTECLSLRIIIVVVLCFVLFCVAIIFYLCCIFVGILNFSAIFIL